MTGRNKEKRKNNRDLERMVSVLTNFFICSVMLLFFCSTLIGNDNNNHDEQNSRPLYKTAGFSEKAVGVMDKGQLQNNTSNFGDLASFHVWFTNAVHWPRTAESNRQYAFGLGLVVAINDTNVIETVTQSRTKVQDWLPPDDAAGRHYSGEVTAVSDETPFMASSDFRETWPYGYYDENRNWISTSERVWPGYFRIDVNHPDFPDTLIEREGEFTSDRDLFCIYNDNYNSRGRAGIEVEQTGYSYGRPYAEDFIFWDMKIHNTSGSDLEDIYIGFYAKFRPDYDNHDYINFIDTDNDGKKDLVYVYDIDNEASTSWSDSDDPLGIVGLRVFDTPNQMGITNFHHFERDAYPTTDEEMWALMSSNKSSSYLKNPKYYFHGNDVNIDYTGLDSLTAFYPPWSDMEGSEELEGQAINYIISSGPFTLNADSMVTISIGLIMGDAGIIPSQPDTSDLMSNVRIANRMYKYRFQGSGPPEPPVVNAVAGDKRVTLFWESEPSENSVDVLSSKKDFEGYKIFRSTDQGRTWGDIITDVYGNTIGYRPIAIFDKVNDIEGRDPAFPQHLGYNTGLAHTYVDSNLINGIEYWYCVTAYDCGNQNPDSLEQSYMYPLGSSIFESHTVSVIPGVCPGNITDASVPQDNLEPIGGICEGVVKVKIIDPGVITGHEYKITFTNNAVYSVEDGDTTFGTGFNLINTTTTDTLLFNHTLSDETGDNLPVVNGFRLTVQNSQMGVKSMSWTKVLGDTCTFDWRYQSKYPGRMDAAQENVSTTDDWRIVVDYDGGLDAYWYDYFSGAVQEEKQHLPIRVKVITDPDNPADVSENTFLCEFAIAASWEDYRRFYYSALGWDLEPGGLGYLAGGPGWYEKHVDMLVLEKFDTDPATGDTIPNYLYLFTNNKPDSSYNAEGELEIIDSKAPSDSDEFTILTYKPFKPGISYTFNTIAQKEKDRADSGNPLDNVRVVPDPYVVTNSWETNEFGKKLQFNHLPGKCTIKIYTLVGELIATIEHDSPSQAYEFWNMRTYNDQFIAPGVYLYYISTPDGDKALGRFLVIR